MGGETTGVKPPKTHRISSALAVISRGRLGSGNRSSDASTPAILIVDRAPESGGIPMENPSLELGRDTTGDGNPPASHSDATPPPRKPREERIPDPAALQSAERNLESLLFELQVKDKDVALASITADMARDGFPGLAFTLADRIQWSGVRVKAYADIALALLDQQKDPISAIARAEAAELQHPGDDAHGIWKFAEVQARLRNFDYAIELLGRGQKDALVKDDSVRGVVAALVNHGQTERAREVLKAQSVLPEENIKTRIHVGFLTDLAQLQQEVQQHGFSDRRRTPIFVEFAVAKVKNGQLAEAYQVADAVSQKESFEILAQIAIAEHAVHQVPFHTINKIEQKIDESTYSGTKDSGYAALTRAHAEAGRIDRALQSWNQMSSSFGQDDARESLITAESNAGMFAEASELAAGISRQHARKTAFETIAKAQAKAGLFADAMQTTENLEEGEYSSDRTQCKIAIAAIQVMNVAGQDLSVSLLDLYLPEQDASAPDPRVQVSGSQERTQNSFESLPFFRDSTALLGRDNLDEGASPNLRSFVKEAEKAFSQLSPHEQKVFVDRLNTLVKDDLVAVVLDDRIDAIAYLRDVAGPRIEFLVERGLLDFNPYPAQATRVAVEKKYGVFNYLSMDKYKESVTPEQNEQLARAMDRLIPEAVFFKKYNLSGLDWNPTDSAQALPYNVPFFTRFLQNPSQFGMFGMTGERMVKRFLSAAEELGVDKQTIFDARFVREVQRNITGYYPATGGGDIAAFAQLLPIADVVAPEDFCHSENVAKKVNGFLATSLRDRVTPEQGAELKRIIDFYQVPQEKVAGWVNPHIINSISRNFPITFVEGVLQNIGLPDHLPEYKHLLPLHLQTALNLANIDTWENLIPWYEKNRAFINLLASKKDEGTVLTRDDLPLLRELKQDLFHGELLKRDGVDFSHIIETRDYQSLVDALVRTSRDWQEQPENVEIFRRGAEVFGYEHMYKFVRREGMTLHTAVHAWDSIVRLAEHSVEQPEDPDQPTNAFSSEQFYGNILQQVSMDDSTYAAGTAHHLLNQIAQSLNLDFKAVQQKAGKYATTLPELAELADKFQSPKGIFASWNNLKRYSDLTQLLEKTQILDELRDLKETGNDVLYRYIVKLALHPTSKVNMERVIQFWRDPELFLAALATHTSEKIHDRKKPSNYVHIPNLDLTAVQLRDALVEGKMDSLQVFTPLEIQYKVPLNPEDIQPLREQVRKAFSMKIIEKDGERVDSTFPLAKNRKELFRRVQERLKDTGVSIEDYLRGTDLPEDPALQEDLEAFIYDGKIGIPKPNIKYETLVATIHPKSSPDAVIAGNDTASCDAFGDGKKTLYMFNPNTAAFTIQIQRSDGSRRTIAQSTLTKDKDIKRSIPDVLAQMDREDVRLEDALPPGILQQAPTYLAADNAEVAVNYRKSHGGTIEALYRDFFKEYMRRNAQAQGLDPDKVVIGERYSVTMGQLPSAENTFAPLAPISYSDKVDSSVYVLDLKEGIDMPKTVTVPQIEPVVAEASLPLVTGLSYLTFEDTIPVSYIEGKAYADNPELMTYLSNMENALIAKDINNAAKGRPNMSLKYVDANGMTRGYMLAYEGKMNDEHVPQNLNGTDVIFISDLATDKGSSLAWGRLIQGFTELYQTNYLNQGKLVPLYLQARDSTSYRILHRRLESLRQSIGMEFDMTEFDTYTQGDDTMHPVLITPRLLQQAA